MSKKKLSLMIASIAMIASTILFGTLAYLTDQQGVTNTFTVGDVKIKVDEAFVGPDGTSSGRTDKGNEYHLIPGKTYTKDPVMTVERDSEPAYVRMKVKITKADEWDAIYRDQGAKADLKTIFNGYDDAVWAYETETRATSPSSITYEFRYVPNNGIVDPDGTDDSVLQALFTSFTVPTFLDGDELQTIQDMEIRVVGEAIQAEGFTDADTAWTAFDTQMPKP